ncbi:hypothetical protein [Staphylococcus pettenkoferi]|uniref:hypothetical protein n=1 Tax=Staphylococcus pettenkoferi TaxID=170573 RepID=UPI00066AC2BF|nr:hypothetical protein [Staphylococcus pettenkoferi]MDK7114628.1 hypothetical protein [Staphylococcus pettenkoferi]MDK7283466.1 hypothetical protein [Staphylococcus pettenkoferi]
MKTIGIPKYPQYELINLISQSNIDLQAEGYHKLYEAIQNNYVFDESLFLQAASVLDIDEQEIFEAEKMSGLSFRGESNSEKEEIDRIITLFQVMVEQRKIRGIIDDKK